MAYGTVWIPVRRIVVSLYVCLVVACLAQARGSETAELDDGTTLEPVTVAALTTATVRQERQGYSSRAPSVTTDSSGEDDCPEEDESEDDDRSSPSPEAEDDSGARTPDPEDDSTNASPSPETDDVSQSTPEESEEPSEEPSPSPEVDSTGDGSGGSTLSPSTTIPVGTSQGTSPPTTVPALFGQSCKDTPCDSSYCDPVTKVCGDWPAVGKACAPVEAAGSKGQRCCIFCESGGATCDSGSGLCVGRPKKGSPCDVENDTCVDATKCVAPSSGGPAVCMVIGKLGDFCSDADSVTCWKEGYPRGRMVDNSTQNLVCDKGVCAEDKDDGVARICSGDQCASTGLACSTGQDGSKRCLQTAQEKEDCYRGSSYKGISLHTCPSGSTCEKPGPAATENDYQLGYCFGGNFVQKGGQCDSFGGGKKCAPADENGKPLSCQFYSPQVGDVAASSVCVTSAGNGESCGGDSFAACNPAWPLTGKCDGGQCSVDTSAVPPCQPIEQVVSVVNPRNISQTVEVCVNNQVAVGEKCQVAAPPLEGAVYQKLRCAEGLVCKQPPNVARFNVDGICAPIIKEGGQCSESAEGACDRAAGFSCANGTCQSSRR